MRESVASHIAEKRAKQQLKGMPRKPLTVWLIFLTVAVSFGWSNSTPSSVKAKQKSAFSLADEKSISQEATSRNKLNYGGYIVVKRHRTVRIDDATEDGRPYFTDYEYAVLVRNRRALFRFDGGFYMPIGNVVTIGAFSFLGRGRKQFFISQDIFRGGNQWVVDLRPAPRIIYDGHKWFTGREVDDMSVLDIDGDGVCEISVPTCIFYGFSNLSPGATPLPTIIFKYSRRARRYLPANPRFADGLLADIEERKRQISSPTNPVEEMNHLGEVMAILLDYIFAGRRHEGWIFYDQAYKLPDKRKTKREILAELQGSPVYRFIYRRRAHRRVQH